MGPDINADRALLSLCGIVRPADADVLPAALERLSDSGWARLATWAVHQGLGGLVARNLEWTLQRRPLSVPVGEALAAQRRRILAQNLARKAWARRYADALAGAGIQFIVLKGVALAEEIYGDLSLRAFNDFDVMVPHESVQAACELAREQGYGLVRFTEIRDWMRAGAHAAGMSRRDGASLDIHWTIGPELPPDSAAVVWGHCVAAPEGAGLPGLRLAPEMALVHLAKHFHTAQYCLLKPLVDFHITARTSEAIEPALVRSLAQALGLSAVVEIAATVAARALGTPTAISLGVRSTPGPHARLAARVVTDGLLVAATERSRIGNWLRYLAAAGGLGFTARSVFKELCPGPLALAQFFNAPFRPRMYPAYYWRQLVKVLTLSAK